MQITVDTDKDSPSVLANVGMFLVLGYGDPTIKAGVLLGHKPQPVPIVPTGTLVREPVDKADDMPPDALESGKPPADINAAKVFAGAAPIVPAAPVSVPLPPSVPVAPVASAGPAIPAPPGPAAPAELDSSGLPYDARIHNKSRTKKQDGTWKNAKGIDAAVLAAVTAELRSATPSVPALPAMSPAAASTAVPVPPVTVPVPPSVPTPPAMVPQPGPVVGGVAPVATAQPVGPVTFREVMKKVTDNTTAAKLTKADVDVALGQVGLKPDELAPLVLPANAALLAAFNALIDAKLSA